MNNWLKHFRRDLPRGTISEREKLKDYTGNVPNSMILSLSNKMQAKMPAKKNFFFSRAGKLPAE